LDVPLLILSLCNNPLPSSNPQIYQITVELNNVCRFPLSISNLTIVSNILKGDFWAVSFMYVYSTLLHMPLLRFHCVGGCWDRIQAI
jgi:hypothetical protein